MICFIYVFLFYFNSYSFLILTYYDYNYPFFLPFSTSQSSHLHFFSIAVFMFFLSYLALFAFSGFFVMKCFEQHFLYEERCCTNTIIIGLLIKRCFPMPYKQHLTNNLLMFSSCLHFFPDISVPTFSFAVFNCQ